MTLPALRAARISGVYASKTPALWVLRYSVKTFSSSAETGYPYVRRAPAAIRRPPYGMIARFSEASVCRPTMISRLRSIQPGACAVMIGGTSYTTSYTPLARSSGKRSVISFQTAVVRPVGPARKEESPSYGV